MRKLKLYNAAETASIDFNSKNHLASEITGLGSGFGIQEMDGRIYDVSTDFEDITLLVHFGVQGNAYQAYKDFAAFILANGKGELKLEYDYDGNKRYCGVYPKRIPKTQKSFGVISEQIVLKRLTPWYEKVEEPLTGSPGEAITILNNSPWPIGLVIRVTDMANDVPTTFMMTTPEGHQELTINPANTDRIIIDAEEKRVYFPGSNSNAYNFIDKRKNTFLIAPSGQSTFSNTSGVVGEITYKKWVLD